MFFTLQTEFDKFLRRIKQLVCRLRAIEEIIAQNDLTTSTTTTTTVVPTTTTTTSTTTTSSSTTTTTTELFEMLDFSGVTDLHAFGDSYTHPGLQASGGGTPAANSYIAKLITTTGKAATNRGETGTGIMSAMYRHAQLEAAGAIPRDYAVTAMTGLNDVNRYGNDALFYTFWKEQYKAFVASNMIVSGIAASDATTTAGSWFNSDGGVGSGRLLGVGKSSILTQTLNSIKSYTFNDDHVVFSFLISNQDTAPSFTWEGTLEIRIDGNVVDTIDCNPLGLTNFPAWEPFPFFERVKIYSGLSVGSHTITVKMIANPSGNGNHINYFGHFGTDDTDTKPMLLGHITYIPNYSQGAPYVNGSDAVVDDLNGFIDDVVDEIKTIRPNLPLTVVKTNIDTPALVYTGTTDFNADGLHWNDSGHDKGYQKFLSRISAF